ncbi:MAG: hypothetical protein AAGF12_27260 [Myxococcota bacterium]
MRWKTLSLLWILAACEGSVSDVVAALDGAVDAERPRVVPTPDAAALMPDAQADADAAIPALPDAELPRPGELTSAHCDGSPVYGVGAEIVVGGSGTEGRVGVTTDGERWTDGTTTPRGTMSPGHTRNLIRGTGYGGGVFVAVGGHDNSYISTSCDGTRWRFDVLGTNIEGDVADSYRAFLSDVAYLDGVFVAAGAGGARLTSTDHGVSWHRTGDSMGGHFRGIASGNGMFLATGHSWSGDTGYTATSTDGETWTPVRETPGELSGVVFGHGVFVTVGGSRCSSTTDGVTFADCGIVSSGYLVSAKFVHGQFYVQSRDGEWWSSTDGRVFTGPNRGWLPQSIAEANGRFIASGSEWRGYGEVFHEWTQRDLPSLANLVSGRVLFQP